MADRELKARLQEATDTLREANADWLAHLADQFGDPRFRMAAGILRGKRPGRKPAADEHPLSYAKALLRTGIARSEHDAAKRAAKLFANRPYVPATTDRLRKKLRRKLNNSE